MQNGSTQIVTALYYVISIIIIVVFARTCKWNCDVVVGGCVANLVLLLMAVRSITVYYILRDGNFICM